MNPIILFCEDPLDSKNVDPDFQAELTAAKQKGLETILFNYDELCSGNGKAATKAIQAASSLKIIIYRGWMLTPQQYQLLFEQLSAKNYILINTPEEYRSCHYLPDSLKFIERQTPKTISEKLVNENSLERLIEKTAVFGNCPVIIKDFVKSEKHDWETACFVPDASDTKKLRQTIANFLRLRDKYLNEGIVIREFVELNDLVIHSKSGMPLTEEYRLFFLNQKLVGIYDYWEEGEYAPERPDTKLFEKIAETIDSHFFSMDIARKKAGELIIIELGDGQVSGLPEQLDINTFYQKIIEIYAI